MKITFLTLKKSVVMLFSFVMVAAMLTMINVGANEAGNPLSSVAAAHADTPPGGLVLTFGATLQPIPTPSSGGNGCSGAGCSGGGTGTGGGSGGGSGPTDPNVMNRYYNCSSVSASGVCTINRVESSSTLTNSTTRQCGLWMGANEVAYDGNSAVYYLDNYVIGQIDGGFGLYVQSSDPEQMFSYLTGYQAPWPGWFWMPGDTPGAYYNGTQSNYSVGIYSWRCTDVLNPPRTTFDTKNVTCGPANDGRPFPYAVGYSVTYRNVNHTIVYYTGGFVFNYDWEIQSEACVYVSPTTPPPSHAGKLQPCYWNNAYFGNYSTNRGAILAGGSPTNRPPTALTPPASAPYLTGANSTAQLHNCTNTLSMNAALDLSSGYAYYRLTGTASLQRFQYYYWDSAYTGGQTLLANIVPSPVSSVSQSVYGTFTCQNSPPFRQYGSWGSLPNITFSYANCGRNGNAPSWNCADPNSPQINNVGNAVELMRDGNYIPTNLGRVNVSGGGIRDSSTGQVGTVADGNMSFMVNVVGGSSPFNGTNANDPKQYFKLWNPAQSSTIPWGTWVSSPNANQHSYLTFFWSSDNGSSWKMTYQAKINTAQFAVPWQDTSNGPTYLKWVTDTNVNCGSGTSNPATIMRSVTTNGQ